MRTTPAILFVGILAVVGSLPSNSHATMWCNMDSAGGNDARKVQEKSARAAAAFLQAASTTFQMLAQLELHLSGDQKALGTAAELSAQGVKELDRTLNELKGIIQDANSLKGINAEMKGVSDLSVAFQQARVATNSPIGKLVADARQKSAEDLLQVCADAVAQLQSADMPMGRTYREVMKRQLPAPPVLWAALAQWNEVLVRGRLVASMFGTLKR